MKQKEQRMQVIAGHRIPSSSFRLGDMFAPGMRIVIDRLSDGTRPWGSNSKGLSSSLCFVSRGGGGEVLWIHLAFGR